MDLDAGTTFQIMSEADHLVDTLLYTRQYGQFLNGIKVEGGGYSMSYIRPGGPGPCVDFPNMIVPYLKTDISVSTTPTYTAAEIIFDQSIEDVFDTQLVITHNLIYDCEYNLAWKISFWKDSNYVTWVDAHTKSTILTVETGDRINAPMETTAYGMSVDLLDRTVDNTTTLESDDQSLAVFAFTPTGEFDEMDWTANLIPSTTEDEWTNEATPHVFQAFHAATEALAVYSELGLPFTRLNVAASDFADAYAVRGTLRDNAFIFIGQLDGVTTALFDVLGHEMGHAVINPFLVSGIINNRSLHEAIADMFGVYVESEADALDWVMGDDEEHIADLVDRDLENPGVAYDCFTEVQNSTDRYLRGKPLGHWFHLISEGGTNIEGIGIENAIMLVINSLPLLNRENSDYQDMMNATLIEAEMMFGGVCSDEFITVARAWEAICIDTDFPTFNGLVTGCDYFIDGPIVVCEEDDAEDFCIGGGLPNVTNYRFTILGPMNTSYESVCGMVGNSQEGCICLNLTDFPKYPYYPQFITIEAYYAPLGSEYITRKRVKLVDCLNDDPTCKEYYDLDNYSIQDESEEFDVNYQDKTYNVQIKEIANDLIEVAYIKVYDLIGKCLFIGSSMDFVYHRERFQGLILIIELDQKNQIISINKEFIGK